LAGYSGTAEILIGESKYEEGTLARALTRNYRSARDQYHGLETIAEICSGDVSALLDIYYNIFKVGNVDKDTKEVVPKHTQHSAIMGVSRKFLELIKTYHPFGKRMHDIVLNFGTLSRKILCEVDEMQYKLKNGTTKLVLNETTRIEVDWIPGKDEEWNEEQEKLMKELIRRSIFIEMEPSRGRLSLGPTLRWQLRRIYCPAFKTGLKKSTAIKGWTTSDLKDFLMYPKDKCEDEFERKWGKAGKKSVRRKRPEQEGSYQQLGSFINSNHESKNEKD